MATVRYSEAKLQTDVVKYNKNFVAEKHSSFGIKLSFLNYTSKTMKVIVPYLNRSMKVESILPESIRSMGPERYTSAYVDEEYAGTFAIKIFNENEYIAGKHNDLKWNIIVLNEFDLLNVSALYIHQLGIYVGFNDVLNESDLSITANEINGISYFNSKVQMIREAHEQDLREIPMMIQANDPTGKLGILYTMLNGVIARVPIKHLVDEPAFIRITMNSSDISGNIEKQEYNIPIEDIIANKNVFQFKDRKIYIGNRHTSLISSYNKHSNDQDGKISDLTKSNESLAQEVSFLKKENDRYVSDIKRLNNEHTDEIRSMKNKYEDTIAECNRDKKYFQTAIERSEKERQEIINRYEEKCKSCINSRTHDINIEKEKIKLDSEKLKANTEKIKAHTSQKSENIKLATVAIGLAGALFGLAKIIIKES